MTNAKNYSKIKTTKGEKNKMKINFDKLNKSTGLGIFNKAELLHYLMSTAEFLESHNKNYNKAQYEKIWELKEIFKSIEE